MRTMRREAATPSAAQPGRNLAQNQQIKRVEARANCDCHAEGPDATGDTGVFDMRRIQ